MLNTTQSGLSVSVGREGRLRTRSPQQKHGFASLLTAIANLWQQHAYRLTNPQELRIWRRSSRFKTSYWQAYDPQSGRSFTASSDAEMRYWIEQRYHQ